MKSANFVCEPRDSRCRYWAKVVRAEDSIPLPGAVNGAGDLPGAYLRKGDDVELFKGDFLLEGGAGREYRVKELKADADAAHARVEGHMLDRRAAWALR